MVFALVGKGVGVNQGKNLKDSLSRLGFLIRVIVKGDRKKSFLTFILPINSYFAFHWRSKQIVLPAASILYLADLRK